jgi:hypothetical protein
MTLNEYLSNFSKNRNLDKIIISWYRKKNQFNPSCKKEFWDKTIKEFNEEVVKQ